MNGGRGLMIAIVAAFIVGCSAGMVGGILFARVARRPEAHMRGRPPRPGEAPRERTPMMERIERTLELEPGQRLRIERVLEESRKGYAVVRESAHAAVERELRPDQIERWRQAEERYLRERRRDSGRPPWRGDRP